MPRSLRLALLLNLLVISAASAQTVPGRVSDFSKLRVGKEIFVVNDSGTETRGQLLRFTPESLAVAVEGHEVLFERQRISTIYDRGDSLRNGMIVGGIAGGGLGAFLIGGFVAAWGSGDCVACAAVGGAALVGLMGMAAGAGIDALIPGGRLVYEKSKPAGGAAISIVPAIAPSRAGLKVGVSW